MDPTTLGILSGLGMGGVIVAVGFVFLRSQLARDRANLEVERLNNLGEVSSALLDAKDQARALRDEADDEIGKKRANLELQEARLQAREEALKAKESEL